MTDGAFGLGFERRAGIQGCDGGGDLGSLFLCGLGTLLFFFCLIRCPVRLRWRWGSLADIKNPHFDFTSLVRGWSAFYPNGSFALLPLVVWDPLRPVLSSPCPIDPSFGADWGRGVGVRWWDPGGLWMGGLRDRGRRRAVHFRARGKMVGDGARSTWTGSFWVKAGGLLPQTFSLPDPF